MASRFKDVTNEEVKALKAAAENLNTRKSTSAQLTGWGFLRTDVMKMALRKTLRRFVLSSWIKYLSDFCLRVY